MEPVYLLVAVALGLVAGVVLGGRLGKGKGDGSTRADAEAEAAKLRTAAQTEVDAIKQAADVEDK